MREVVAEFERPVMLYSIGKDSSVLLRLAQKAFYPGPIPFPLLHVDTTYKFREMIEFRDSYATRDRRPADRPHQHGSDRRRDATRSASARSGAAGCSRPSRCSTRSRQAISTRPSAAPVETRRNRAPRSAIFSFRDANGQWDPKNQRPELWNLLNSRDPHGREHPRVPAVELDRARRLAVHPRREHPDRPALLRQGARGDRARRLADHAASSDSCRCCRARSRRSCRCRMRSLGCSPCTGAIRSDADTVPKIIAELVAVRLRAADCASSTTTRKARWRSRSGKATSNVAGFSASAPPAALTMARAR